MSHLTAGRKHCTKCGCWRHACDFPIKHKKRADGTRAEYVQGECYACKRVRSRQKYHEDPRVAEQYKIRNSKYRAENQERIREYRNSRDVRDRENARRRERYRELHPPKPKKPSRTREEVLQARRERHAWRMANDPEYVELRREYTRIYQEARRRQAGMKRRDSYLLNRTDKVEKGPRLPVEPIAEWIKAKLANGYAGDVSRLARNCGLDESQLRRIRDAKYDQILEGVVDSMLTNEGSTDLWMVYPSLYE